MQKGIYRRDAETQRTQRFAESMNHIFLFFLCLLFLCVLCVSAVKIFGF